MKTAPTTILLLTAAILTLGGCRKVVEDLQTKALIDIITSGRWVIDQFTEASTEYAQDYGGYEFKFNESGTVDAYKGSSVTTGTFVVDAINARITSRFPVGSAPVLLRLNETWTVTKASISLVEAKPTDAGRNAFLRIRTK
ncbi:MAG: hypothetical protein EBZ67_11650 [Chitinophagia bacterium]|nr:hypothetical protein [Chitinophagia bacterium]